MLLCNLESVTPGVTLAASVINPASPDVELLKPGVVLDERMLQRLARLGVTQLWIDHNIAADLEGALSNKLGETKIELYRQLKSDLSSMSQRTISAVNVNILRQSVMELICNIVGSGRLAGIADRLFSCRTDLFTHGVNVAHLAIVVGLELENYIVKERSRLSSEHARDMVSLGLAAMLHDIGKVGLEPEPASIHEIHNEGEANKDAMKAYREHARLGYEILSEGRAPASVTQTVLNHHQRFNGAGWPDLSTVFGSRYAGTKAGKKIHVFTRIVSAANVLDNLMYTAEGKSRPPIAALWEFASNRFDGWFDPVVQRAVLRKIPPFPVGSHVQLSDGRAAVVSQPSLKSPCRPIVRLMLDGNETGSSTMAVNLMDEPELFIANWAGVDVTPWLYELPAPEAGQQKQAA